jgi:pre-mRNA-splicing factor CWC22
LKKEEGLEVFRFDEEWEENEVDRARVRGEILGEDESGSKSGSESGSGEGARSGIALSAGREKDCGGSRSYRDGFGPSATTIYLTIMSSATFEE